DQEASPASAILQAADIVSELDELHLGKPDDQQDDDRREIEPPDIRQKLADRSVDGLGQPIEDVEDHGGAAVVGVDHAERDQPARNRRENDDPPVNIQNRYDNLDDRYQ